MVLLLSIKSAPNELFRRRKYLRIIYYPHVTSIVPYELPVCVAAYLKLKGSSIWGAISFRTAHEKLVNVADKVNLETDGQSLLENFYFFLF